MATGIRGAIKAFFEQRVIFFPSFFRQTNNFINGCARVGFFWERDLYACIRWLLFSHSSKDQARNVTGNFLFLSTTYLWQKRGLGL